MNGLVIVIQQSKVHHAGVRFVVIDTESEKTLSKNYVGN